MSDVSFDGQTVDGMPQKHSGTLKHHEGSEETISSINFLQNRIQVFVKVFELWILTLLTLLDKLTNTFLIEKD